MSSARNTSRIWWKKSWNLLEHFLSFFSHDQSVTENSQSVLPNVLDSSLPKTNNLVLLSISHLNCCKYHELVFLSPVSSVPSLSLAYFQHLMILLSASAVLSLSRVWLFATPWTVACQTPCPWGFSRQEYWSGLPCPPPGDLLIPGIEPRSPTLPTDSLPSEPPGKTRGNPNALRMIWQKKIFLLPLKTQKLFKA